MTKPGHHTPAPEPGPAPPATRFPLSSHLLLLLTFFGGGFMGLVLEIAWVRVLGLVFGASNYAISTVLAAYMAGLALGGVLLARWLAAADRDTRTVTRAYSLLIAGIGVTGALVAILTPWLPVVTVPAIRALGWNSPLAILARGLLGFVVLLVPATMIGGLVPVASQLAVNDVKRASSRVALLYFVNTLGSVFGAVAAGFFLLERLGVTGTSLLAAGLGILFAALGLAMKSVPRAPEVPRPTPEPPRLQRKADRRRAAEPVVTGYPRATLAALVIGYGLSGFAGLGYQVIWARALTTILGQPVYSVTIVTAACLTGLALGSIVFGRLTDRWRDPMFGFGIIESSIGGFALLTMALLAISTHDLLGWVIIHSGNTWAGRMLGMGGFCFLLVLIPTLFMGASFPAATRVYVDELGRVGSKVGKLYASNAIGALLGSLVAGFLLVPLLGATRANLVLAGVSFAVALTAILASRARWIVRGLALAGMVLSFFALALYMSPRGLRFLPPDVASAPGAWRILHYKESAEGVVTTGENRSGDRQTWVNSSVVCGSALPALKPVRVMGLLPFALHENPKDILVVGYGLGVTTSMLVMLSDRTVDVVEICPEVVRASREFSRWNMSVFANPKLKLMGGDGRNYLLCTTRSYDVISCDPTHPSFGSGALYTREFYQLCRKRLNPGGIMTIYFPLHQVRPQDFRMLINTFRTVFPECALWFGVAHGVMVGRKDAPLEIDYARFTDFIRRMPIQMQMALIDVAIAGPAQFAALCLLDPAGMKAAGEGAGVAVDDLPDFEYGGARAAGARTWVANAELILRCYTGPAAILRSTSGYESQVAGAVEAAAARFRATMATMRGDRAAQIDEFRRALQADSTDAEARRFLEMSLPPQ